MFADANVINHYPHEGAEPGNEAIHNVPCLTVHVVLQYSDSCCPHCLNFPFSWSEVTFTSLGR